MTTHGENYDPQDRWEWAYEYARVWADATVQDATDFADNTGGDGGELTVEQAWERWGR